MLNLSDITSKFRTIAMFVITGLKTTFLAWCVGMFTIYLSTKFHTPNSIA
jgi:uncharacterized membrane protein YphA (DoxX/SURF4 family)